MAINKQGTIGKNFDVTKINAWSPKIRRNLNDKEVDEMRRFHTVTVEYGPDTSKCDE